MSTIDVVIGDGPIGRAVTAVLREQGRPVRVITRTGPRPVAGDQDRADPGVEHVAADASDVDGLRPLLAGAASVHHCAHAAYTARAWRQHLPATEAAVMAAAHGVVVFPESLYSYTAAGAPMTEDGPRDARGGKRGVRTRLLAARAASDVPTVSVVASDYFGPGAGANAHAGDRMLAAVTGGRVLRVLGSPDQPHSFTYLPDLARAMVAAGQRDDLHGRVLHAPTGPAVTQRQMAAAFASAAGAPDPRLAPIPAWLLRAGAVVPGSLREIEEVRYQFTAPFVMASQRSQDLLDLSPTSLEQAAAATVARWRADHPSAGR